MRVLLLLVAVTLPAWGLSTRPLSWEDHTDLAVAIGVGKVLELRSWRDEETRLIYTTATMAVEQTLKGTFPARVKLVHRGGIVEGQGDLFSFSPQFQPGERYLLFLSRRPDGTLFASQGGASAIRLAHQDSLAEVIERIRQRVVTSGDAGEDVTDQAAPAPGPGVQSVLLTDQNGVPSRFLAPDRGEAIPVIVDLTTLPLNMTSTQATQALHNALQAWSDVSSITFHVEAFTGFEQSADVINIADEKLRIQMHDNFGAVPGGQVLGIGGRAVVIPGGFESGGAGGRVFQQEFHQTTHGYVVLKHSAEAMQNLKTFEEVLTHEIGHALGLDHSSEDPEETNEALNLAVMYFRARGDDLGAQLAPYDIDAVRLVHPHENTPPYGFDRVMRVVTFGTGSLAFPEVNQISLAGFDLQGDALTVQVILDSDGNGQFSMVEETLTFTPAFAFEDAELGDPNSFFDRYIVRYSDGVHLSPPVNVHVIAFRKDTQPAGAPDGLPDSWMAAHFQSTTPVAGTSSASDDPDGDGFSNLQEYLAGTSPMDFDSKLKITVFDSETLQWLAQPFDLYELLSSSNLTDWTPVRRQIADSATGTLTRFADPAAPQQFFRLRRVP